MPLSSSDSIKETKGRPFVKISCGDHSTFAHVSRCQGDVSAWSLCRFEPGSYSSAEKLRRLRRDSD